MTYSHQAGMRFSADMPRSPMLPWHGHAGYSGLLTPFDPSPNSKHHSPLIDQSINRSPLPDLISNSRRAVLVPSVLSIATRLESRDAVLYFATHLSPSRPAHSMHDLDPRTTTVQQGSPRLAQDIPRWLRPRPHPPLPRPSSTIT